MASGPSSSADPIAACTPAAVADRRLDYRFVPDGPAAWAGRNAVQRFQVELSAAGILMQPMPSSGPAWEWRFALARSGGPARLRGTGEAVVAVAADRAELLRGRISEWVVNSAKGLQHALDLPEGEADAPAWLDFAVGGNLTPKVGEDGANVAFVDERGNPVVLYRDLRVVDAREREVGARWERIEGSDDLPGGLRLVIDMDERPFPARVMGRIVAAKGPRELAAGSAGSPETPRLSATPGSVAAPLPLIAPGNDLCAGAEIVPDAGPFPHYSATHDITDATTAGDPPAPSCQANVSRSIWFRFTPAAGGLYSFSVCQDAAAGSSVSDTVLAIYAAAGDCSGLAELAGGCDDDTCSIEDFQSVLTDLSLIAGATYYVVAWQYGSAAPDPGAASIQIRVDRANPPGPAPANDQCAGAETIPGAGPFPWTTMLVPDIGGAGTAGDPPAPSCQANVSRSVWYSFTPAVTGRYTFSTCADAPTGTTVNDTVMALYAAAGACSGLVQVAGACDDDSCGSEIAQSVMTGVTLAPGTTYHLVVWQYGTVPPAPSNTAVQVRVSDVPGPAHDTCGTAASLAIDAPVAGSSASAANDYQLPAGSSCFSGIGQTTSMAVGGDVVYRFAAPAAGKYSFRASGIPSTRNAVLYVTTDCPSGAPPLLPAGCLGAANRSATGPAEEVRCLALASGQTVYLYVDENATTAGGAFTLEASACSEEAEPNDAAAPGAFACGIEGAIGVAADVDYFSLGVPETGARLFALADGAAANSTDFDLRLTTATDTLEYDDQNNDPLFGAAAPNLAGTPLGGAASFLRVSHYSPAGYAEPYRLYAAVQGPAAAATAEAEPNDTPATATGAANRYYAGALSGTTDVDHFAFPAAAGDLVLIGLDLDPLRNNTPFNGTLALLDPAGATLVQVNDPGATSSIVPGTGSPGASTPYSPGEGIVHRVRTPGTYYAKVAPSGTSIGDYLLSIGRDCRVLPGTDLSVTQSDTPDPADPGAAITYTITVRNLGGHPATGVTLRDELPAGASPGTVAPSQGTCQGLSPVICHLGTLAAGATAVVTLAVTAPGAPGSIVNQAWITTFVADDQAANDTTTEATLVGSPDTDGDGVADGSDCAPGDPAVWAVPGEARSLTFPSGADTTMMEWLPPLSPGGTLVSYDLLRSAEPGDVWGAACVASGLTTTAASDPAVPAVSWFYLVRARNACGGNLGAASDGTPRAGAACP